MVDSPINFSGADAIDTVALRVKQMDLESGVLGRFFGSEKNAPTNIAGTIAIVLVFCGVLLLFWPGNTAWAEYWKVTLPLISTIVGYMFGKRSS